jgi:hypothetical protein
MPGMPGMPGMPLTWQSSEHCTLKNVANACPMETTQEPCPSEFPATKVYTTSNSKNSHVGFGGLVFGASSGALVGRPAIEHPGSMPLN